MKRSLTTHEAKTHLSKVIEDVLAGAEVVICRGQTPVVKVVRYQSDSSDNGRPKVGVATSAPVKALADAFAPLTDTSNLKNWGLA